MNDKQYDQFNDALAYKVLEGIHNKYNEKNVTIANNAIFILLLNYFFVLFCLSDWEWNSSFILMEF